VEEKGSYLVKISKLRNLISDLHKENTTKVTVLVEKATKLEGSASGIWSELAAAEEKLALYKLTSEQLEVKYLELKSNMKDSAAINDTLSSEYESVCESERSLRMAVTEQEHAMIDAEHSLETISKLIENCTTELDQLNLDRNCKENAVRQLSNEEEALVAENREQNVLVEELKERHGELTNWTNNLLLQYQTKCRENQGMNEDITNLCVKVELCTDQSKFSDETCNLLKLSFDKLESELKMKENSIHALLAEKEENEISFELRKSAFHEEMQRLTQQLGIQVTKMSQCELKHHDIEESFQNLLSRLKSKCSAAEELKNEFHETRYDSLKEREVKDAHLNRVICALSNFNAQFEEILQSSELLRKELKSKEDEGEDLQSQVLNARSEFDQIVDLKEKEYFNLKKEYEQLHSEASDIKVKRNFMKKEQAAHIRDISELSHQKLCAISRMSEIEESLKDIGIAMKMITRIDEEKQHRLEGTSCNLDLGVRDLLEKLNGLETAAEDLERTVEELADRSAALEVSTREYLKEMQYKHQNAESQLLEESKSSTAEIQELNSLMAQKDTESSALIEKNLVIEESNKQLRLEVISLEDAKAKAQAEMNEKLLASETRRLEFESQLVELGAAKMKGIEEFKTLEAELQRQAYREIKRLRLDNDKKTEMNQPQQKQVSEITGMIRKQTEMLLNLSSQHQKYQDFAASRGFASHYY
jgi:chromosome segregation ATPase